MSWDEEAATWEDHAAVRLYADHAFDSLVAELSRRGKSLSAAKVLDFGCGTGLLAARMADEASQVVGIDISAAMIDVLSAKGIANLTAFACPLSEAVANGHVEPNHFDLITCSSVCAFVPDYPGTVRQLAALLVPGGLFVQWDWELNPSDDEPMGLTQGAIREALESARMSSVLVETGFRADFEGMTMAPLLGSGVR